MTRQVTTEAPYNFPAQDILRNQTAGQNNGQIASSTSYVTGKGVQPESLSETDLVERRINHLQTIPGRKVTLSH
jgi:hypothetical protein